MIRANIDAEIDSLDCKIAQGIREYVRIQNLINKQLDMLNYKQKEIKDLMYKRDELKESLNEE